EPKSAEPWTEHRESETTSAAQDSHTFAEYQALPEEPPRAIYEAAQPEVSRSEAVGEHATHHDLSDEEVTSLAEQLAEARHEEVSAKAEADADLGLLDEEPPHVPESAAETDEFIAEADAEEQEEVSGNVAPEFAGGLKEPQ